MKILVDESTGPGVARWLLGLGHEVLSVYDEQPGISDREICRIAFDADWLIFTNDKDFGELIFKDGLPHHGVVLLRLADETVANKILVLRQLLELHGTSFKLSNPCIRTRNYLRVPFSHHGK
ncbi:MAG: DUF5615 family PIN-like protein [Saprospiraceae bacterium]|nr:DUF5615 family PIN-like protein [Saprospiraceae bacterium]